MARFLTWYINNKGRCRAGSFRVNIQNQVNNYKKKFPQRNPVVIFDLMSCIAMLVDNEQEILCAGRHKVCTQRAIEICENFKKLDVKMVFFLHGPIKTHRLGIWLERTNEKYKNQIEICQAIKNNEKVNYKCDGQIISTYFDNFLRVAEKYGEIRVSIKNECHLEMAVYAKACKALAVITSESDFLIWPGDYQIWLPKEFNLKEFSVVKWCKQALRESLGLRQEQMPVLATICGNAFLPFDMLMHIIKKIPKDKCKQELFAKLVVEHFPNSTTPLSNDDFDKLVKLIHDNGNCKYNIGDIKSSVNASLNFYNIEKYQEYIVTPDWLREHIESTNSAITYIFLNDKPFHINQNFIDLTNFDVLPYCDLVLPIIQRQMGIVLKHQPNNENITRKVYYKSSDGELFKVYDVTPIYPDGDIPKIENLLGYGLVGDEISDDKRLEILGWALSSGRRKLKTSVLSELSNSIFMLPSLILNYLVKSSQITVDEADVLLLTLWEVEQTTYDKLTTIKPPTSYKERPFWIAFVYTQLMFYFLNTFIICGLHKLTKRCTFDGYIFHHLYSKYLSFSSEEKRNNLLLKNKFRIYRD